MSKTTVVSGRPTQRLIVWACGLLGQAIEPKSIPKTADARIRGAELIVR
jgi:hypothetical protein